MPLDTNIGAIDNIDSVYSVSSYTRLRCTRQDKTSMKERNTRWLDSHHLRRCTEERGAHDTTKFRCEIRFATSRCSEWAVLRSWSSVTFSLLIYTQSQTTDYSITGIIVTWRSGSGGIQAWSRRRTGFLQCCDTVGLVIWSVKIVPEMTYSALSGTLSGQVDKFSVGALCVSTKTALLWACLLMGMTSCRTSFSLLTVTFECTADLEDTVWDPGW